MPPRSIPTEIFTLIFRNLSLQDLYRCLFVSHRWHGPAEAQLYSDVALDALEEIYKPLITAIKTRRHLLRNRILVTFPYLKDLSIDGWMHAYAAAAAKDTVTEEESQYRLETLTFDPRLLCREGPDAFMFSKRLGNLKRIQVKSLLSPYDCFQKSRPWAFGRALKEHCSKLESVETSGTVALWLYDLPILLPSQISHIISLTGQVDTSVQRPDGASAEVAPAMMTVEQLRQRVQEQEYKELLAGKEAVPFFPQLKRLVMGVDHSFSLQDLISLGVQASTLTSLEICHQPHHSNCI
ncbi:hypothetical protein K457DRAFT_153249 [Linnemannia elongata AG-77]|uniref:F-box domain-containing protein n=1 Tax=Linnemannia elongata AG-77 TaxID=1314771 RepID=A0A197K5L6_9FUNG|nr:hypothetical protein K457DRAFT_153249 [Linnemannia elongata AG-77]